MTDIPALVRKHIAEATADSGGLDVARLIDIVTASLGGDGSGPARAVSPGSATPEAEGVQLAARVSALEAQNRSLQIALDNMPHGLYMIGPDSRLILSNRRVCEVVGVVDGALKPGMTVAEILMANPVFASVPEEVRRKRVSELEALVGHPSRTEYDVEAAGGGYLRVVNEPLPGGGYVSTLTDVTDQRDRKSVV